MSDLSKTCERLGDHAAGVILSARLSDLDGYWLELRCCGRTTLLPVHLIIERQGGQHRLGDVLQRLRCKLCSGAPCFAWVNETHNRTQCNGAPPGWSVQLIPAALARQAAE